GIAYLQRMQQEPQLPCGVLQLVPIACGGLVLWIPECHHAGELGNDLLEQLQPLSAQFRGDLVQPRDVAAGPRDTLSEPAFNKVARRGNHNRDGALAYLTANAGDVVSVKMRSTWRRTRSLARPGSR